MIIGNPNSLLHLRKPFMIGLSSNFLVDSEAVNHRLSYRFFSRDAAIPLRSAVKFRMQNSLILLLLQLFSKQLAHQVRIGAVLRSFHNLSHEKAPQFGLSSAKLGHQVWGTVDYR